MRRMLDLNILLDVGEASGMGAYSPEAGLAV